MKLLDMLAAAVRPWVRVHGRSGTLTVEFGDRTYWGPRWALDIRDAEAPVGFCTPPKDYSLIGDLRWSWRDRSAIERAAAKSEPTRNANDSKVAA